MSRWPEGLSVKRASKLMSWFSPTFSGALVNATVLTLLLKSFAGKKCFSRGVLASTARFLRLFSWETLPFLAPDSITDFGIALAKRCNLAFCSFVLQTDWSKTFSDGTRNNQWQLERGAWVGHGAPRFLAGSLLGPPVFCLISRSSSFDWHILQITFSQQNFKRFEDFLVTVLTIFTSLCWIW